MNYLKGLIKCEICQGNYNYKNNNGQEEYLCGTKKNYSRSKCDSPTIKQSDLIYYIQKHCELQGKNFEESKIKLFVRVIKVSKDYIKIFYKNGDVTEIYGDKIIF